MALHEGMGAQNGLEPHVDNPLERAGSFRRLHGIRVTTAGPRFCRLANDWTQPRVAHSMTLHRLSTAHRLQRRVWAADHAWSSGANCSARSRYASWNRATK